eukprot:573467_1
MASTCNGCDDQILYTIMANIGDARHDVIELSPYFSWLNPFLRFLPMWIERNRLSKPKRSLWIRIGILLTLCAIWFRFGVKALWNIQSPKIIAYKMTYILYECILTISRSLSLYYFYFIFDYDMWISLSNKCAPYDGCCIPTVMYRYNCFLKICLFVVFCIGSGMVITREIQYQHPYSTMWEVVMQNLTLSTLRSNPLQTT